MSANPECWDIWAVESYRCLDFSKAGKYKGVVAVLPSFGHDRADGTINWESNVESNNTELQIFSTLHLPLILCTMSRKPSKINKKNATTE